MQGIALFLLLRARANLVSSRWWYLVCSFALVLLLLGSALNMHANPARMRHMSSLLFAPPNQDPIHILLMPSP
jgi:hypothetical protein